MIKLKKAMSAVRQGFTLVELLVVIGILAILTAVVLVAVNPGRQLQQARNTQRKADVNTILSAITAYMADSINSGQLPTGLTVLCSAGTQSIGTGAGEYNLGLVIAPRYVAAMPVDPQPTTGTDSGYDVCVANATERRVKVSAPNSLTDGETTEISVTR